MSADASSGAPARDVGRLAERLRSGDRSALSSAITAVERGADWSRELVRSLEAERSTARVVGLTGPPGAGKSTLVGSLVKELLSRGQRVGALLVDPSSPISGGAVLADRVRMQPALDDDLYVRSVAARGHAGGVSETTEMIVRLLAAWGADVILVETVGAGQGDVEVCGVADCTVVVCPPGLGDELQAMKAGLMEVADVFVVNKADRPGAAETASSLADAGHGGALGGARPVVETVATTGEGAGELLDAVDRHVADLSAGGAEAPSRSPRPSTSARRPEVFDLSGRVAIVTGASSGLGQRFAEVLHHGGAKVVLAARRLDRLSEIAEQLPGSVAVRCDVTDADQHGELAKAAIDAFGRIDVLVNSAGMSGPPVPAEELSADRWESTLAVNLTGLFGLTSVVARQMLAQGGGSVVNIGSVFGLVANAPVMDAAYAASKGAVVNLTRELAVEWAPRGVRVNAIAPGWFPSEMTSDMTDDEASQRYIRRSCPMRRMGERHELDGAILFLASDASTYCTGQTITVDGGWTAR